MKRSSWILSLLVFAAFALGADRLAPRSAAAQTPPNLVVIMTDDLTQGPLIDVLTAGLMPNLKIRLIDAGVTFVNSFVTNPNCCPSRATYLRGQYAHSHRVYSNITAQPGAGGINWAGWFPANGQPGKNESTIATWLQDGGFFTGHIGKYLNGYGRHAPDGVADPKTYIPPGWSDWQGLIDLTTYQVYDYEMNDNGTVVPYGDAEADYQTDVLAGRAVDFIEARALDGEPFFLTVTPLAPHVEVFESGGGSSDPYASMAATIRPAPRHAVFNNGDPSDGEVPSYVQTAAFNEADMSDKPSCPRPTPPDGLSWVTDPYCLGDRPPMDEVPHVADAEAQYKSMSTALLAVDDLIGDVMDALKIGGLLDNTVVIFTSDNGWHYGEHRLNGKQVAYEESIRVPLVVRGPGFAAGAIATQLVLNNDLAPTLADLGGVVPPYDPDGRSLVPLLTDPARDDWPRKRFMVEHWFVPGVAKFENPSYSAIRSKFGGLDFLYVTWRADPVNIGVTTNREYYNLATDPLQINSVNLPSNISDSLDLLISNLRTCAGQLCRALESF